MRMPESPPSLAALMNNIRSSDPKLFVRLILLMPKIGKDKRYMHWDELSYRKPPFDLTHEQWWLLLKLRRRRSANTIPLKDTRGRLFRYNYEPEQVFEGLHYIDRGGGGPYVTPAEIVNPATRNTHLMRSLMEEAISSSQLEGATTTRQVAKTLIRTGREPADRSERMILNNYLTMERIREMRDAFLTKEMVFEIHKTLTEETFNKPDAAGRFRRPDEETRVFWDATGDILHTPPRAEELEGRMQTMCDFANGKTPDEFVHPVIRSIILHFWLAYDHPFLDGNGRVARALFYWSMLKHGFWLFEYISISEAIKKSYGQYRRAFLYTETDDNDLTYFILYHLKMMQRAVENLYAYIKRKRKEQQELEERIHETEFNYRQRSLLIDALRNADHTYTIVSHMKSHRVTYATARTDLYGLRDKGLLVSRKVGKTYYFKPPADIERMLASLGRQRE